MSNSARSTVAISNRLGLHARPATLFARTAQEFEATIEVRLPPGDSPVDGKSVLMMMSLGATCGTRLEISATGCDARAAVDRLVELVGSRFEED